MSLSVSANNLLNSVTGIFNKSTTTQAAATTTATTPAMASDAVSLSSNTNQPLPSEAGTWKKISNSIGEAFSNVADKMHVGETYKVISQEFDVVDKNHNNELNFGEFNIATLNVLDFMGTEFAKADKNHDNKVDRNEYVDYRKQQLGNVFDAKEKSGDKHLNVNEIGFIGQQLLTNRDPRLDENQDGLVNKREFTRAAVRGSISIRDFFGI